MRWMQIRRRWHACGMPLAGFIRSWLLILLLVLMLLLVVVSMTMVMMVLAIRRRSITLATRQRSH